jgi:hypothetical protein
MPNLYKTFKQLKLQFNLAYVCEFWLRIANIPSALTANVFDNNRQYTLHFSAPFVITNWAGLLFEWKVLNIMNCTSGLFARKLILIHGFS